MTPGAALVEREFQGQRCVEITLPQGDRALVSLFGAQVLSWQTADAQERFYLSPRAVMDRSAPIRGGVPICFPQFNQRVIAGYALPKHGCVRNQVWAVSELMQTNEFAEVSLALVSNAETLAVWPYWFNATVSVRLEAGRLRIVFNVSNPGTDAFSFALALHGYLAVSDIEITQLDGFGSRMYWDAVGNLHQPEIRREQPMGPFTFDGEIDRIYSSVETPLELTCAASSLRITQSANLPDTVVWNPGAKLCAKLTDMPEEGWRHMVCVEAARIHDPQRLAPGESWSGWQQFEAVPPA